MAMYLFANKLTDAASGSGAQRPRRRPLVPVAPPVVPPLLLSPPGQVPTEPTLLQDAHETFSDTASYYYTVRGSKFMSGSACNHIVMNSCINFMSGQKVDAPQVHPAGPSMSYSNFPITEVDKEKPALEYRDGQIVTATLCGLIDNLQPTSSRQFKFTFLLCSRLVLKPYEILKKVCKNYFKDYSEMRERGTMPREFLRYESDDMLALVSIISEWSVMFPHDFRDDRVMGLVRIISERCSGEHMSVAWVKMSTTMEILLEKLNALENYEESLSTTPQMGRVKYVGHNDVLSLDLKPHAVAAQLAAVEHYRLSFVGPEEFVHKFAPHSPEPQSPATDLNARRNQHVGAKATRNLEAYTSWFNRLTFLVATDIVQADKPNNRARIIEHWVMTARECFNLGNFNSLMAILGALNMPSITRLKKTWSRITPVCAQQLRQMDLCLQPCGNHARYRAALAAAPSDTAVPLLSVTCRDLHFANLASASITYDGRINFTKWSNLARFVERQLAGRRLLGSNPPPLKSAQENMSAWLFFDERPNLSETAVELASFELEGPVNSYEKEREKHLRTAS